MTSQNFYSELVVYAASRVEVSVPARFHCEIVTSGFLVQKH